jgi:hypothetical protein
MHLGQAECQRQYPVARCARITENPEVITHRRESAPGLGAEVGDTR